MRRIDHRRTYQRAATLEMLLLRIFQPFAQSAADRDTNRGGLGLSIARRV
jgi:hypothetical protein